MKNIINSLTVLENSNKLNYKIKRLEIKTKKISIKIITSMMNMKKISPSNSPSIKGVKFLKQTTEEKSDIVSYFKLLYITKIVGHIPQLGLGYYIGL